MNIHFFERKVVPERISIEKVFSVIKVKLSEKSFGVKSFENPYPSLSQMLKAMWYFKNHQGDINHITGDIHWACLFLNPDKTVLTIHDNVGFVNYRSGIKRKLYFLLWLYLPLKKLKYITVISQKTKDELLEFYPIAKDKIRVINNPLTAAVFKRNPIMKNNAEDFRILIVGTRENKNVDRILDALENIKCSIDIVGETNDFQNEKINRMDAKIDIHNFVSDKELEYLYRKSDILCFPSLYEGFGMPIIEAQANGCAVITSNIEPMISVAGNGAVFVNPKDVSDIEAKINLLIGDFELRCNLIENGYQNAQRFLPEAITEQYINLYKEILNGSRTAN